MKRIAISLWVIALLTLMPLVACEREGPPKPVGTATNKHVEQAPAPPRKDAAEAMTGAMKAHWTKLSKRGRWSKGQRTA